MDPELLRRYGEELAYLREVGAEFAHEFPAVARGLAMDGIEVADPYVERLLEGFAFLAARVQLKLDAEHPRFIQHLLEAVCPNFVAPVPSLAVLRLQPDLQDPNLARGAPVPRGTGVTSTLLRGQGTACEFRTAHALQLWPLEIVAVRYTEHAGELPLAQLPAARQAKGALRIRLRAHGGASFDQLPIDALPFYIAAGDEVALRLHALVLGAGLGSWVAGADAGAGATGRSPWRGADSLRALGLDDEHALLPETARGFSGHRLLQEYAAMPQRLLFFEVGALRERLRQAGGTEVELLLLFSRGDAELESMVDAGSLALFCTPAINLFWKRLDPIDTGRDGWEHHVVPDRTRPLDYEVHALDGVVGHGNGRRPRQAFLPLYSAQHEEDAPAQAYYSVRREPRVPPRDERRLGGRSAYVGSELFIALVDPQHAPYEDDIRQLALTGWVTNRDLPLLLPAAQHEGGEREAPPAWRLDAPGPVRRVDCLRGPTRPVQRLPRGEIGWSLVNLLALNQQALVGMAPERAAAALRRLLHLFGPNPDPAWARRIEGVLALRAAPATRRLPGSGPLTFGTGVAVDLTLDDLAFPGGSAFLFGSVLEHFFARHAAINSFTQTTLRSAGRGLIHTWPPRCGRAPLL